MPDNIVNVGCRTELDAMVQPVANPRRADRAAYWELVGAIARSDSRHVDKSRDEIIAILNAAGVTPSRLSEDVDIETNYLRRRRRDYL